MYPCSFYAVKQVSLRFDRVVFLLFPDIFSKHFCFINGVSSLISSHIVSFMFRSIFAVPLPFTFKVSTFTQQKLLRKKLISLHTKRFTYFIAYSEVFFSLSSYLYFIEIYRRTQTIELTPMLDITNYLWMHR